MDIQLPPGSPMVMDLDRVADTLSISVTTVQKLVREGAFPKPRVLSDRRVGWITSEVAEWVVQRPPSDLLPPPNTGAPKPRRQPPVQA